MKCKNCRGTGERHKVNWETGKVYIVQGEKCPVCGGTGEVEQTNEEWLHTLNTEQLAEFLSKIEEQYPCGSLLKCDVTCGYHSQCRGDDVAPTNKEAWVEWLKQPHTPIS